MKPIVIMFETAYRFLACSAIEIFLFHYCKMRSLDIVVTGQITFTITEKKTTLSGVFCKAFTIVT